MLDIFQFAHLLGNERPSTLRQVEAAVWRLVLRVASGSTAQAELPYFFAEFEAMVSVWEQQDVGEDYRFFKDSESVLLSFMSSLTVTFSNTRATDTFR